jgi:hypothetical protein
VHDRREATALVTPSSCLTAITPRDHREAASAPGPYDRLTAIALSPIPLLASAAVLASARMTLL